MADILDLADARDALGWKPGTLTENDADLTALYIPAVTEAITNECGRMEDRRDVWRTDNPSPITTPWSGTETVRSVRINGTLAESTDWSYASHVLTITAGWYTAGDEVTITAAGVDTPALVKVIARRILRRVWNADHPQTGGNSQRQQNTGASAASPRIVLSDDEQRALWPYSQRRIGGFA